MKQLHLVLQDTPYLQRSSLNGGEKLPRGAVLLNVKVADDRRRVDDACVTFLLGLFRQRRISDVRRLAAQIGDADRRRRSATCGDAATIGDAESVTQNRMLFTKTQIYLELVESMMLL